VQLNVYVPREREALLQELDRAARATGRPKNELVLEALEAHLKRVRPDLGVHSMGGIAFPSRAELYEERWDR
jgi:hypothetical protein